MKALVLHAPRALELRELPDPVPGPHDAVVRVRANGLCGTDFHIWSGEANYHLDARGEPVPLARHPQILGHEIAGVVEAVGREVRELRPGARVVLDQGRNCWSRGLTPCEYCASGDSHQCEHYAEHGITGLPGGLADYVVLPAVNAVPIESELPWERAAIAEPLACVLHACDLAECAATRYRLRPAAGQSPVRHVLICGAGPAGLMFVQVLRRLLGFDGGILVSEPDAAKRALAASFGAIAIDPGASDLAATVAEATGGRRVECLIEASGSGPLFRQIPGLLRRQGTLMLYGHGHGGAGLEALNAVQFLEPSIVSPIGASGPLDASGRPTIYRRALRLLEDGTIETAPWLTDRYHGLARAADAFGADHLRPGYMKGVALL